LDLITAEVARQLSKKAVIHLTDILNSILRLLYFPVQWKTSVIILITKPNKPPDIPTLYRPISLLPLFAKLSEKLTLKRIPRLINLLIFCIQFLFLRLSQTFNKISLNYADEVLKINIFYLGITTN
jgi:hypothetical protein